MHPVPGPISRRGVDGSGRGRDPWRIQHGIRESACKVHHEFVLMVEHEEDNAAQQTKVFQTKRSNAHLYLDQALPAM